MSAMKALEATRRDLLKMSDEEIKQLLAEDVLHNPANTPSSGKSMF
jgi:hypothetical protein